MHPWHLTMVATISIDSQTKEMAQRYKHSYINCNRTGHCLWYAAPYILWSTVFRVLGGSRSTNWDCRLAGIRKNVNERSDSSQAVIKAVKYELLFPTHYLAGPPRRSTLKAENRLPLTICLHRHVSLPLPRQTIDDSTPLDLIQRNLPLKTSSLFRHTKAYLCKR